MTAEDAGTFILEHTPSSFQVCRKHTVLHRLLIVYNQKMLSTNYSNGIEKDDKVLKKNDGDHTKWSNPLEIRYELLQLV